MTETMAEMLSQEINTQIGDFSSPRYKIRTGSNRARFWFNDPGTLARVRADLLRFSKLKLEMKTLEPSLEDPFSYFKYLLEVTWVPESGFESVDIEGKLRFIAAKHHMLPEM